MAANARASRKAGQSRTNPSPSDERRAHVAAIAASILVWSRPAVTHRFVDERQTFANQVLIPRPTILILKPDNGSINVELRRGARVLQQLQSDKPHNLGFGRKKFDEQASESDRFLAPRCPHQRFTASGGIAVVANEIQ
jgi:hypothetical protein